MDVHDRLSEISQQLTETNRQVAELSGRLDAATAPVREAADAMKQFLHERLPKTLEAAVRRGADQGQRGR